MILMKITIIILKIREVKAIKNKDTLKEHKLIPTGSAVVVQKENGTITEHGENDHNSRFC